MPFSCVPGRVYRLEVRTRAAQVEFLIDGKSLLVIHEVLSGEQHWRLTLSTHPRAGSNLAFSQVFMTAHPDPFVE